MLCVILYWVRLRRQAVTDQTCGNPAQRTTRRSQDPKPFPGLTIKPYCDACKPGPSEPPPMTLPPRLHFPYGRPRTVATHHQFCQSLRAAMMAGSGGAISAPTVIPSGGPWRQLFCVACGAIFWKPVARRCMASRCPPSGSCVWFATVAEGLGIRAVARVFEVDPNTVLAWLTRSLTTRSLLPLSTARCAGQSGPTGRIICRAERGQDQTDDRSRGHRASGALGPLSLGRRSTRRANCC